MSYPFSLSLLHSRRHHLRSTVRRRGVGGSAPHAVAEARGRGGKGRHRTREAERGSFFSPFSPSSSPLAGGHHVAGKHRPGARHPAPERTSLLSPSPLKATASLRSNPSPLTSISYRHHHRVPSPPPSISPPVRRSASIPRAHTILSASHALPLTHLSLSLIV